MTRVAPLAGQARPGVALECVGFCLLSLVCSVLLWLFVQRTQYAPVLAAATPNATLEERLFVAWTVCAETWLCLVPGLVAASLAVSRERPRLARTLYLSWACVVAVFESLDLEVYLAFGRHLHEFAGFIGASGAVHVAGIAPGWLLIIVASAAASALVASASMWLIRHGLAKLAPRLSPGFQRVICALTILLSVFGVTAPAFSGPFYRHLEVVLALDAQLVWAPRVQFAGATPNDRNWARLSAGLRRIYTDEFKRAFAARPLVVDVPPDLKPPSILLVVLESWRADAFTSDRMPRLFAWAQSGLVAKQHYAGSTYSEAGMFSLLYGRSPLLYHATLDARVPLTWCSAAHTLGMDCAYYSGQPKVWMRVEEFTAPQYFDHFVHDNAGDWNEWDRKALKRAVHSLHSNARPEMTVVYLMSTHFEYAYPPAYERHLPVVAVNWSSMPMFGIDPSQRVPLTNRYLNSLAFTDDLVADAIAELDRARTLVVLTGDHGESLGESGHFGHAYSFGEVVTKVPFAMVGPGITATTRDTPSLHADLIRTLLHAVGARARGPSEAQDLLSPSASHGDSLLFAHCAANRDTAEALLVHGNQRIRLELGLRSASLEIKGPEDALGKTVTSRTLNEADIAGLLRAFEHELASFSRAE